ncbi:MAG: phosphate acyltransferase [Spirochaetales bacterium]|nr:phosphate acyltransferase [Spirochaetales bacterium]
MIFENFDELINKKIKNAGKKNIAVVNAEDDHTLHAVMRAGLDGIAKPILIGDAEKVKECVKPYSSYCDYEIVDAPTEKDILKKTIELVNAGKADALMKGKIQTADLMRMVVSEESGFRTGNLMSHMLVLEIPTYHKLITVSDVALVTYPDLEKKKGIIKNTVGTLHRMGFGDINVAALAAVDTVNPKMPESVEAGELKKLNETGEIPGCYIEGPISYDLAVNKESSIIKGYESPVAGEADMLLCHNIAVANTLAKCLTFSSNAKAGGMVVGAKVPIILTSRASSTEEKYYSTVIASSLKSGE